MVTTSQNTHLSIGQLHILEMMNRCRTEESLRQQKRLFFKFYSNEAVAEADRLWNAGVINESKKDYWDYNRNGRREKTKQKVAWRGVQKVDVVWQWGRHVK
jgi:hypothetical protein